MKRDRLCELIDNQIEALSRLSECCKDVGDACNIANTIVALCDVVFSSDSDVHK